ncbi:MAG: type IX secretion system outer membrane channel protein PorV [Salinibacter sp.]
MSDSCLRLPDWLVASFGVFVLSFGLTLPAHAQLGESSGLFLRIEPDSRGAGMGNAGVAVADNANAMFWNPAGLASQTSTQVGVTHANWLPEFDAGLFYEYLVGTYHVDGVGTFGGNVTFLNLGTTELVDGSGNTLGESSSYQIATGVSYARQVSNRLSLGTNLKFVYSKLTDPVSQGGVSVDDGTASSVAFDLGGLYRSAPFSLGGAETTFSSGVNIANMGGHMRYEEDPQALPMNMRVGYAFTVDFDEYNSLTFANDFNKSLVNSERQVEDGDTTRVPDPFYKSLFSSWGSTRGQVVEGDAQQLSLLQQFTLGTGLEYWYSDLFALRSGYFYEHPNNGGREFLNFGAGLRYNIVGVDISYIYTLERDSPLANTLRFSLLFEFQ